jgi:hypothetical protein
MSEQTSQAAVIVAMKFPFSADLCSSVFICGSSH